METIISVKGLRKTFKVHVRENEGLAYAVKTIFHRKFKNIIAVDNIDLEVGKGEIRALIGPNGAGKSTMIKILSGVLYPTKGEVNVIGYVPWHDRKKYVRRIGVLFGQKTQLTWELPAIDTFAMHKVIYKIPETRFRENLEYMVEILNIEEIIKKPVRNLSLGERMKCEFVCALLHDPDLVFLDEPTIGLDVIAKDTVRCFIKKINKERGITFIVTTHDLNEIKNLCSMITIINHGSVVYNDTLENLKFNFNNSKVIELRFSKSITKYQAKKHNLEIMDSVSARLTIDSKNNNFQEKISSLLRRLPVQDISIQAEDIETIIKEIYLQKQ
jgi:ABC-2 type transport system ATP-binding protein